MTIFGTALPVNLDVDHGARFEVLWPHVVSGGTFTWLAQRKHNFTLGPDGLT